MLCKHSHRVLKMLYRQLLQNVKYTPDFFPSLISVSLLCSYGCSSFKSLHTLNNKSPNGFGNLFNQSSFSSKFNPLPFINVNWETISLSISRSLQMLANQFFTLAFVNNLPSSTVQYNGVHINKYVQNKTKIEK